MEGQVVFKLKLKEIAFSYLSVFAACSIVTILALELGDRYEAFHDKRERAKFEALPFEAFAKYYAIIPAQRVVGYGAEARHISDAERFKGGYRLDWDEIIQCDHNPHDDIPVFEYYAEVLSTGRTYKTPQPRKQPEELVGKKGFPAISKSTGKIIRYPEHDADCRILSFMTMTFPDGHKKFSETIGEVAQVRGA